MVYTELHNSVINAKLITILGQGHENHSFQQHMGFINQGSCFMVVLKG